MTNSEKFCEILKTLHTEDISYQKIGTHVGVKRATVSHWENGKRQPNIDKLCALADFFGVSLDYLVGRSNDRKLHDPVPVEKPSEKE